MFISQADYINLYSDDLTEAEFNRLYYSAKRLMQDMTTGVDGYVKLTFATPTDEDTLEALKYCAADLIHTMHRIEALEKAGEMLKQSDGTMTPAVISSKSAGTESISYSTNTTSALHTAVGSLKDRTEMFGGIVKKYLSGMKDANGVNLLYMGVYPYVC